MKKFDWLDFGSIFCGSILKHTLKINPLIRITLRFFLNGPHLNQSQNPKNPLLINSLFQERFFSGNSKELKCIKDSRKRMERGIFISKFFFVGFFITSQFIN